MKNILDDSVKNKIVARIEALEQSDKPLWGKMSVDGMMCHAADQIRMAIGEKETKFIGNAVSKTIVKFLVLFGMPTPKAKVETVKELKQGRGGTKTTDFENDKQLLLKSVEGFEKEYPEGENICHPFFGNMNKKQWGRLIYLHLDFHLKQFGK